MSNGGLVGRKRATKLQQPKAVKPNGKHWQSPRHQIKTSKVLKRSTLQQHRPLPPPIAIPPRHPPIRDLWATQRRTDSRCSSINFHIPLYRTLSSRRPASKQGHETFTLHPLHLRTALHCSQHDPALRLPCSRPPGSPGAYHDPAGLQQRPTGSRSSERPGQETSATRAPRPCDSASRPGPGAGVAFSRSGIQSAARALQRTRHRELFRPISGL